VDPPTLAAVALVLNVLGAAVLWERRDLNMRTGALHMAGDGLGALGPLVHPGSLVLALTDFATLDESAAAAWAALAVHNDLRLFWVTDRLESEGLPDGQFRIGLPGRSMTVDGASSRAAL